MTAFTPVTYGAHTSAAPVLPGYVNFQSTVDGGVTITVRSEGDKSDARYDMPKAGLIQLLTTTLAALSK